MPPPCSLPRAGIKAAASTSGAWAETSLTRHQSVSDARHRVDPRGTPDRWARKPKTSVALSQNHQSLVDGDHDQDQGNGREDGAGRGSRQSFIRSPAGRGFCRAPNTSLASGASRNGDGSFTADRKQVRRGVDEQGAVLAATGLP